MSIDTLAPINNMSSLEKQRSREGKKHKSSQSEKKRKRDSDVEHPRSRSKKRRAEQDIESEALLSTPSPFHMQTATIYLPLAPISQQHPLEGLCAEHLSPLLLTYYPPLSGVILSYHNVRLSEEPYGSDDLQHLKFHNIDEYAVSWSWVTVDFLLFKPVAGIGLEGFVNLQSQGHIGIVCWNLFNASIEAKRLPKSWRWVDVGEMEKEDGNEGYAEDGAGYWQDENGDRVEGKLTFRVFEVDSSSDKERGFLSIEGTMLDEAEEVELSQEAGRGGGTEKTPRGIRKLGATDLGVPVAPDSSGEGERLQKHRRKY